jgi:hypothetical protein
MPLRKLFFNNYLLLTFLILCPTVWDRINENPRAIIWSDSEGYYKYLPGVFILGDVHQIPAGSVWPLKNEQGEILLKYTCGVALFELPFFLGAKQYCSWTNNNPDDFFNVHYCRAIGIGGFLIAFLGLFFLKKGLLRYFSPAVTFWTVMAVFFGTNLFHYATKDMGMSHVYSFFLIAFLVWQTPRFYARPSVLNALLTGGALGWLILIRPTNIVALLFVLLYDVYSWADFKNRLGFFFKTNSRVLLPLAASAILFFIPQLLYWHEMTGNWVHYSYTDEGFIFWNKPKIAAVLFDTQNGLFLYSPMALLMVLATLYGLRVRKFQSVAVALIFGLSTYLFASWWAWWFGGAFGHRSYIELYALLAIPLAGLIEFVLQKRSMVLKASFCLLLVLLMAYSVRLSFLYQELPRPWDGPEWRWNWDKMVWIWSHLF